tara:strand:+ start:131 stop:427 length:297 start_codon:yes stop_codon:yes gene_type:complete
MTGSQMIETILDINPDAEVVLIGDDYDNIQWDDTPVISLSDLEARYIEMQSEYDNLEYSRKRTMEYPSIADQLDDIYHNGIDAWKTTIKLTKDAHPKP